MTQATAKDYWIARNVIHIQENALGQPNYMQVSVATGASILCYMQGVAGLGYDNGHNYRRWTLQAAPTLFNSNTPKYIYVAIPREGSDPAWLVYPSEEIDLYGQNAAGEQIGDIAYYYIYLQAYLTATDGTNLRELRGTIVTGMLSTDEALMTRDAEWYRYNTVDEQVSFLKKIYMTANSWFTNLRASAIHLINRGRLIFGESDTAPYIDSVADTDTALDSQTAIVTPAYGEGQWLSKTHDDTAEGKLTFKDLVTIGNEASQRTPSTRMLDLQGSTRLTGGFTIGERFNKGIEGGHCDQYANAELNSLVLRESLTVPKLIFEKTEVTAGNTWHCSGGGKIKRVWENVNLAFGTYEGYGLAELDLVDGEIGAVADNDICQGVWHLQSGNDTANSDTKDGNFSFAGFKTIYFLVYKVITQQTINTYSKSWLTNLKKIMSEEEANNLIKEITDSVGLNRFFFYQTREKRGQINTSKDKPFTDTTHPQPQMDFAAYGNTSSAARQLAYLQTTQYALLLANVSSWNYNSDNFQYIRGNLSGFNIRTTKDGTKALTGYGIAFGKAYMWGNIEQFDRDPSIVSQQLYYLTTDQSSGVTTSTPGWKTDYTPTSPEKPYLWQYYLITYDNGNTEPTTPFIAANYASDGTGIEIKGAANAIMDYEVWDMMSPPYTNLNKDWLYLIGGYALGDAFIFVYNGSDWEPIDAVEGECYVYSGNLYSASKNPAINNRLDWIDCGNIKGAKGDSGQNAIIYEVECSLSQWKKEDGETDASLYLVKIDGANRTRMTYAQVQREGITVSTSGHTAWIEWNDTDQQVIYTDGQTGTATITFRKQGMVIATHTFTVSKDGAEGAPGSPGNRGSSFRVLRWEEVKQGDQLYARQQIVGEDLTLCDVVIYTDPEGTKTKWLCIKDYTREASDIPSLLPEYFKAFNSFQNIATEVFLADIANIDQLQVNKVLIYDTDGNKRVDMSPNQLYFNAPVINEIMEYDFVNKTCHVIDVMKNASIATQYMQHALLFMPDKDDCPHSGLHVYVNAHLDPDISAWATFGNQRYWQIWNDCATQPDTVTGMTRGDINDLMNHGTLVCADQRIFYGNDKHPINGADPQEKAVSGDFSYYEGRFCINGTMARFIHLMPGQTLSCRSSSETYTDPDGNERQCLIWYVENASDFIPCEIKVKDERSSGAIHFLATSKFLNQTLDPQYTADSYQDMFFGTKITDANLYRDCYGTQSAPTANIVDHMYHIVLRRDDDRSTWWAE